MLIQVIPTKFITNANIFNRNIERVNSLKARFDTKDVLQNDWEKRVNEIYSKKSLGRRDSIKQIQEE